MEYKYSGAAALVALHEKHLNQFKNTWLKAKELGITLPPSGDPDCLSLNSLIRHVLRSAGGYMTWMCEMLGLPNPGIEPLPEQELSESDIDEYLKHLTGKWTAPLSGIEENQCHNPAYLTRWGSPYCIEAMLEHAVMHPVRHEFQLLKLINATA